MNELDEIYFRALSNDALGGDLTALNAVKWDRVEDDVDGQSYGHDDMTGQRFALGEAMPPVAPAPVEEKDTSINTQPPAQTTPTAEAADPGYDKVGDDIKRGMLTGQRDAGRAFNETAATVVGAPVDLMNEGLQYLGLGSDYPIGGSDSIRDALASVVNFGSSLVPKEIEAQAENFAAQKPQSPLIQNIVNEITKFGINAVTPAVYLRAFTVATPFARGLAWGGIADFINAQPNDESAIAQITRELSGASPDERSAIENAVMTVLERNNTDPDFVNKARTALDGMVLGAAIEKGAEVLVSVVKSGVLQDAFENMVQEAKSGTLGMGVGPVSKNAKNLIPAEAATSDYPNMIQGMLYDASDAPPVPPGARKWTKAALARSMQEKAESSGQAITVYNDATRETLATRVAGEAMVALKREGNASDWYNSKIVEMNNSLRQLHPELTDGSTEEGIFKAGLSLTSNGSTVDYNLKAAEHVYSIFKETGRYPTDLASLEKAVGGFGQEGPTLIKQFQRANTHIDEMGSDGFVKFLNTKFTVKELIDMGYKINGESVNFETYGSAIFGPKIGGGFYQNLKGNFDPVTFDRWWMASWGRWTGQPLIKTTDKSRVKQLDRFRTASGKKYNNPKAAIAAADKVYSTYRKNNFQPRTELNQAAQRLSEGASDRMKEQPSGPSERSFMRDVAYAAVEKLRQAGYNVTPADLQATVWYPEKELHGFYGIGSGRSAPDDYAAAAQRLLGERNAEKSDPKARQRMLPPDELPMTGAQRSELLEFARTGTNKEAPRKIVAAAESEGRLPDGVTSKDALDFYAGMKQRRMERQAMKSTGSDRLSYKTPGDAIRQQQGRVEGRESAAQREITKNRNDTAVARIRDIPGQELWSAKFKADVDKWTDSGDYLEFAKDAVSKANMEAVPRALLKEGWTMRHASKGKDKRASSRYLISPDKSFEVRLSDHELPDTPQRAYMQAERGTRWHDELVLRGDESPIDVINEIKELYRNSN